MKNRLTHRPDGEKGTDMKLTDLLSVVNCDEQIHIIEGEKTIYFGGVENIINDIAEGRIKNANVIDIFCGFVAMCIEVIVDTKTDTTDDTIDGTANEFTQV